MSLGGMSHRVGSLKNLLTSHRLHIASVTSDFDADGLPEIVGSPLDLEAATDTALQAAILAVYERLPTGRYELAHTLESVEGLSNLKTFITWTVDDTDGDTLLVVLATDDERAFLIESTAPRGYPNRIIWESPFLSGGRIADLDRDGQKEIIGADNNNDRLLVFEYDPTINAHVEKAVLVNETSGSNVFAQNFAIADFDEDGRTELVAGDSEGEIFLYESTTAGNTFRLEWQTQPPAQGHHPIRFWRSYWRW